MLNVCNVGFQICNVSNFLGGEQFFGEIFIQNEFGLWEIMLFMCILGSFSSHNLC